MTILIISAIIIVAYLYINNQAKKQKVLKEELEQKRLKEQRAELESKRQIEEIQRQKVLKEKQELEQKQLKEQRAELERKRQIEEVQRLKALKEELEQNQLKEQQAVLDFKNEFTIYANNYLTSSVTAFYHADYNSGGNWKTDGTIENMIWTLKNDASPFPYRLPVAKQRLEQILLTDLPIIKNKLTFNNLTVCVVPRAKAESHYKKDQLLFKEIISLIVDKLPNFIDGTKYIIRHANTRTTHLDRNGEGGDGNLPYPGITKNTCTISEQVNGKDILLIDDIYTKSVNIDEDAIQALFDNGAKSVTFYAIGKTVSKF